jgi:hypothetical protein
MHWNVSPSFLQSVSVDGLHFWTAHQFHGPVSQRDSPPLVELRTQSQLRAVVSLSALLLFSGGLHEKHVGRSPAVKKGTRTRTATTPTYRRSTRGVGKCQLERRIAHDVRSRSAQDQSGAEGAMGEAQGEADEDDITGGQEADRSGAAVKVGEGESREEIGLTDKLNLKMPRTTLTGSGYVF